MRKTDLTGQVGFLGSAFISPPSLESARKAPKIPSRTTLQEESKSNIMDKLASKREGESNLWKPPLCLQRRNMRITAKLHYRQHFPLELTLKDYLRRLFDLLGDGIREQLLSILNSVASSTDNASIGSATLNEILSANSNLDVMLQRILGTLSFSNGVRTVSVSAAEHVANQLSLDDHNILVTTCESLRSWKTQIMDQKIDSCRLGQIPGLFQAGTDLLNCFGSSSLQGGIGPMSKNADAIVALTALRELEEQLELHAIYKEQRMRGLGWAWCSEDVFQSTGAYAINPVIEESLSDRLSKSNLDSSTDEIHMLYGTAAFAQTNDYLVQMEQLLEPKAAANIVLLSKMLVIADDVSRLSRLVSEEGGADADDEAYRLRHLSVAVESAVDARGKQLLDSARDICRHSQQIISELARESEGCRRSQNYEQAKILDRTLREIARLRSELNLLLADHSLLDGPLGAR